MKRGIVSEIKRSIRGCLGPSESFPCVRAHTLRRLAYSLCLALVGFVMLPSSPTFALRTHIFQESFGPDGTAASHFEKADTVAIDRSTGAIYVGDAGVPTANASGSTVERLNSIHGPEPFTSAFTAGSEGKLPNYGSIPFMDQVAVSPVSGNIYFASGGSVLRAYDAEGEPVDFEAGPGAGSNGIAGSEICGVAVDSSGDIYVSERMSGVQIYAANGKFLANIASIGTCDVAVNSQGSVYLNAVEEPFYEGLNSGPIEEFTASAPPPVTSSTIYAASGTVDSNRSFGIALDTSNDHLYVDESTQVAEYGAGGERLDEFGAIGVGKLPNSGGLGSGIAISQSGDIYVTQGNFEGQVEIFGPPVLLPDVLTGAASEINPQGSARLNGAVNPDGVTLAGCHFEYVEEGLYEPEATDPYAHGASVPCVPAAAMISPGEETAVHDDISGLTPGMTYHFRLVASNENGSNQTSADATFTMPPKPLIEATSIANLTSSSVDLNAKINPGGLQTTCLFEYGTSDAYGASVPCQPLGVEGLASVPVSQHIEGLSPNITYHWRVVATNAAGTASLVDHTFIYDTSGGTLPDHRAYEMVTPPHKNAALIGDASFFGLPLDFAEDGSDVILPALQCFESAQACDVSGEPTGAPFLFSRTATGWTTTAMAPPATEFEVDQPLAYSAATETGLFIVPTPLGTGASFYVRSKGVGRVVADEEAPPLAGHFISTNDFSRIVYESGRHGEQAFELGTDNGLKSGLVGVSDSLGGSNLISECGTAFPYGHQNTLSSNGETLYFTAMACSSGTGTNAGVAVPADTLYARVGEDVPVKISERSVADCTTVMCQSSVPAAASFIGASVDGSKAFFVSSQQLTDDASSGEQGPNLYEYDFAKPPADRLMDLSAGGNSGHGPRVRGVVALSSDGSHVYFVANDTLTTSPNRLGQTAQDGADNLYLFERDASYPEGRVSFVAQLSSDDQDLWEAVGEANVTPDGRFLVFESHGALTPDDTRSDNVTQIFRYDAEIGNLIRISVGRDGFNDDGDAGVGNAKIVRARPNWLSEAGVARPDPTMSHNGAFVFFESPIGLTSQALDDLRVGTNPVNNTPVYAQNIYEWHEGLVSLISDGRDTASMGEGGFESAVALLGSDASGANVFFRTADPLVARDTDTQIDWYDARICEPQQGHPCITEPPPTLPPCSDEECHGVPAATPPVPGAATAALSGENNSAIVGSSPKPRKVVHHRKVASHRPKGRRGKASCHGKRGAGRRKSCRASAHRSTTARVGGN